MKIIAWKQDETQDAEEYNLKTLDELWTLVRERTESIHRNVVHEISANTEFMGDVDVPYLVLAWVEVEN